MSIWIPKKRFFLELNLVLVLVLVLVFLAAALLSLLTTTLVRLQRMTEVLSNAFWLSRGAKQFRGDR